MRKNFFSLLVAVMICNAGFAQKKQKPSLTGIWQMCMIVNNGEERLVSMPILKFLSTDKHFYNLITDRSSGFFKVSGTGTYKETSDSTYVEYLDYMAFDKDSEGQGNVMTYHFSEDGNLMFVSFTMPGSQSSGKEIWRRTSLLPAMSSKNKKQL
ncbi:MAG: DUF4488 domain-containing protein [Prevotella sp.]|nr:DUF4488 domain-containing protein [Prevotella sp.]